MTPIDGCAFPPPRHKRASGAFSLCASALIEAAVRTGRRCRSQCGDERHRPPNRALLLPCELSPKISACERHTERSLRDAVDATVAARGAPYATNRLGSSVASGIGSQQNATSKHLCDSLTRKQRARRCGHGPLLSWQRHGRNDSAENTEAIVSEHQRRAGVEAVVSVETEHPAMSRLAWSSASTLVAASTADDSHARLLPQCYRQRRTMCTCRLRLLFAAE